MSTYVFAVQLDRRPSDTDINTLGVASGGQALVYRDERYAVLRYVREAATLSHAIAATVEDISCIPGLNAWWIETYD